MKNDKDHKVLMLVMKEKSIFQAFLKKCNKKTLIKMHFYKNAI